MRKAPQTMWLRVVKKLRTGNIVKLVLTLNLVFLLCFTLQGFYTLKTSVDYSQNDFATPLLHISVSSYTSLSPLALKKLNKMKTELNDSTLTNQASFPAKRIGRYVLLDPDLCKNVDHVDIVIIVHTAPDHLERRQRIRDSFAQESLFRPFTIRVAFLLGKTINRTMERMLWAEHVTYNDTVMGEFIDHYHNLSLKGVMGYRWVSQHCSNSEFVLKIDDDVLVNTFKLLYSFLNHMSGKKKSIFCNLWYNNTMPILREGKWKVESHVFGSRSLYPYDYCSGFVVIMTTDLMAPLYQAALTTPFFWIDDIYLFGMLPSVVGEVTYYNYAINKNVTLNENLARNCTLSQGPRCPILATVISDNSYWSYWNLIKGIYMTNKWSADAKVVH